jgi:hypothetical protein
MQRALWYKHGHHTWILHGSNPKCSNACMISKRPVLKEGLQFIVHVCAAVSQGQVATV